ncbi:MAG: hypothetical protein KGL39_09090 [Patescibacteria group bacterium]|nr:hypothetical protein [Patescibacteria group bacterium]
MRYFEGCLPIEEMADRGDDVLRFGPLKPVGLRDPRTGKTPYAVGSEGTVGLITYMRGTMAQNRAKRYPQAHRRR